MQKYNLKNKYRVSVEQINEIKFDWDKYIINNYHNPIFLKEFIIERSLFYKKNGWECINIIFYYDDKVIGVIPLRYRRDFSHTYGKFLLQPHFSPDFIVSKGYEKKVVNSFLDIVLNKFNWYYLDLSMPIESKIMNSIKDMLNKKRINYSMYEGFEHRIIKKDVPYDVYYNNLANRNKKEFRRIERKLKRLGERKVTLYENGEINQKIMEDINEIEKRSWKQSYRIRRSMSKDPDIEMIWNASKNITFHEPSYKWSILFLELDNKKIAYAINLQLENYSTVIKTSFDNSYRKYSPGVQIVNEAVKELYSREEVECIDFLTNLPFSRKWSDTVFSRKRIILSPYRFIPRLIGAFTQPIFKDYSIRDFLQTKYNMEMRINISEDISDYIRNQLWIQNGV